MGRDNGSQAPVQPRAGGNVLTLFLEPLVTMKLIPWVPSMGGSLW
jgi:hypothetical protein